MIVTFSATIDGNTNPHTHKVHELVFGVSGRASVCVEGHRQIISNSQSVLVPAGVGHRYELVEGQEPARATYVCFDSRAVTSTLTPALNISLEALLEKGATTALIGETANAENQVLADMLKRTLKLKGPHYREKAGNLLSTILLNHLLAVDSPAQEIPASKHRCIEKVRKWIDSQIAEDINIDDAAAKAHMSRSVFTRYFRKHTSQSFSNYVNGARVRQAAGLLAEKHLAIAEVAFNSGFNNLGHFYKQFYRHYGMTPAQFRNVSVEMTRPIQRRTG